MKGTLKQLDEMREDIGRSPWINPGDSCFLEDGV